MNGCDHSSPPCELAHHSTAVRKARFLVPQHIHQNHVSQQVIASGGPVIDMTADNSSTPRCAGDGNAGTESDNDDASSESSSILPRPLFPPVLPYTSFSSNISSRLPQVLAATISAVEPTLARPSPSPHRHSTTTQSQSPPGRLRQVRAPSPSRWYQSEATTEHPADDRELSEHRPRSLNPSRTSTLSSQEVSSSGYGDHGSSHPSSIGGEHWYTTYDSEQNEDEASGIRNGSDAGSETRQRADLLSGPGYPSGRVSFQRLTDQYSKLKTCRSALWETFDGLRSKSNQRQEYRHLKEDADLAFIRAAQELLSRNDALHQLLKNMQDAQLRYQEAEQRFDDMIDELQNHAAELEVEERRFFTVAVGVGSVASQDALKSDSASQTSEISALRGISGDRPEDIHPLFEEYKQARGELQLARELLFNTRMKRRAINARHAQSLSEEKLKLLQSYGDQDTKRILELKWQSELMTGEEVEMLQDYDRLEKQALADIDHYTKMVRRLQTECREKRVIPETTPYREEGFGFEPLHPDEIHLGHEHLSRGTASSDDSAPLAHPVFPLLLSNPTHLLGDFPQTAEQSLRATIALPKDFPSRLSRVNEAAREVNIQGLLKETKEEDKTDYVNRWLLQKLHSSAMEAEVLWGTFQQHVKILDMDQWQRDVLYYWGRDGAANPDPSQVKKVQDADSLASVRRIRGFRSSSSASEQLSDSGHLDQLEVS
ncbi:hypothetical protein F4778DRAFT_713068 [Xylariomycetidae sp. FL2044]|nr:hypothetical protein F4778DRAFT_713068 [Xylariomycetidae sp. FL2044]